MKGVLLLALPLTGLALNNGFTLPAMGCVLLSFARALPQGRSSK